MYLDHWQLKEDAFTSKPDSKFYFACDDATDPVADTLRAVARKKKLILVTGEAGTGKTTCLRRISESLDTQDYEQAFITNPASSFSTIMREIAGQLLHRVCGARTLQYYTDLIKGAVDSARHEGKRTIVIIDNFTAGSCPDLAALHSVLIKLQEVPVSFVIAGAEKLKESINRELTSAQATEVEASFTTCGLASREKMESYIHYRLKKAGRPTGNPFTPEAMDSLWICRENRNQRHLNSVCRLCLKRAAETNSELITASIAVCACADLTMKNDDHSGLQHADGVERLASASRTRKQALSEISFRVENSAKDRLASQLAAEKVKHLDKVMDPFEAWSSAREEILSALDQAHLRRAAS